MCGLVTVLCGLGYAILFAKRKWMRKDESPEQTYIRQNQRTRRMRRRRMRSSMSFSGKNSRIKSKVNINVSKRAVP